MLAEDPASVSPEFPRNFHLNMDRQDARTKLMTNPTKFETKKNTSNPYKGY